LVFGSIGGAIFGYAISAFHCQCSALASMDLHPVLVTAVVGGCAGIMHGWMEPVSALATHSRQAWMAMLALPSGAVGLIESFVWAAPWYAGPLLVITGAVAGASLELYLADQDRRWRENRTETKTPAGFVMGCGLAGHAAILGWLSRH